MSMNVKKALAALIAAQVGAQGAQDKKTQNGSGK